ncbi:nucleoside permease [Aquimarina algiphila]|uniref:nucleoside permease n=1 Tax=Aquimarina algiphila TaxID=2047982 RepID=UPI002493382C|nr:nucleoside permease [Aquimarina algiphila]
MNIKTRLTILNFLEYCSFGSWLLSAGAYMIVTLKFSGTQVGAVFSTLGIASMFMPPLLGVIADKWLNTEKLFGVCHLILAVLFMFLSRASSFNNFYLIMLLISMVYMPSLALNKSIAYHFLEKGGHNPAKTFPSIRVWGTVGFILVAWTIDLMELKFAKEQFYLGALISTVLGFYAFLLPTIPIDNSKGKSLFQRFGLDAFELLKDKNTAIFLFFSFLLGTVLQITNIWGVPFLDDFKINYADSFAVKHSVALMTLSQMSEVVFILAIPYFLKKFGIKKVVLISILAWVFRFGFFAIGTPEGIGLIFLVLSMIVYGVAFDFYFVSGSLYINHIADTKIRSGAQGVFLMMVNGFGAAFGGYVSGFIVDLYTINGIKDWTSIWVAFTIYALIIGIAFAILFKHNADSEKKLI